MARILIAEDDPQACEMMRRICQFKGHEVEESRDAAQALTAFDTFQPDLVITDLAMPLGGGQRLLRELRAKDAGVDCPVIVITGYATLLGEREREDLKPHAVLKKPVDLEGMLAAVEEALALSSKQAPENGQSTS
ncbi:MAG: response regulator [Planctomycetota bacterium]|nr:response regulator [Planctomycetota bacterium]